MKKTPFTYNAARWLALSGVLAWVSACSDAPTPAPSAQPEAPVVQTADETPAQTTRAPAPAPAPASGRIRFQDADGNLIEHPTKEMIQAARDATPAQAPKAAGDRETIVLPDGTVGVKQPPTAGIYSVGRKNADGAVSVHHVQGDPTQYEPPDSPASE